MTYSPATALKESNALAATTVFTAFCVALERYAVTGGGEAEAQRAAIAVAREMAQRRMVPERVLSALRITECGTDARDYASDAGRVRAYRYTGVLDLMLSAYFARRTGGEAYAGDAAEAGFRS